MHLLLPGNTSSVEGLVAPAELERGADAECVGIAAGPVLLAVLVLAHPPVVTESEVASDDEPTGSVATGADVDDQHRTDRTTEGVDRIGAEATVAVELGTGREADLHQTVGPADLPGDREVEPGAQRVLRRDQTVDRDPAVHVLVLDPDHEASADPHNHRVGEDGFDGRDGLDEDAQFRPEVDPLGLEGLDGVAVGLEGWSHNGLAPVHEVSDVILDLGHTGLGLVRTVVEGLDVGLELGDADRQRAEIALERVDVQGHALEPGAHLVESGLQLRDLGLDGLDLGLGDRPGGPSLQLGHLHLEVGQDAERRLRDGLPFGGRGGAGGRRGRRRGARGSDGGPGKEQGDENEEGLHGTPPLVSLFIASPATAGLRGGQVGLFSLL